MNTRATMPTTVVLLVALAITLNYVDRGNLATAAPVLHEELQLSNAAIGVLLSSFFWAYAPAQLVAGWLVHRFDLRIVLACGVALWAAATTLTAVAYGFTALLLLRLLLGLGESVTFPSWQLLLARHSVEADRGRAAGLVGAGQGVGPMLGTLCGGLIMARFGWRAMFVALGILTFLWVLPWLRLTRRLLSSAPVHSGTPVGYGAILRQRDFWGAALGHFFANYPFYFVITWMPTFLVKAGGFTLARMAVIGAAVYGIYAVATALSGALSDRLLRRGANVTRVRKAFALSGVCGIALTLGSSAFVEPRAGVWLLGIAAVFLGITTPMIFSIGATLAGPRAAGRWAAAQNFTGQLAGIPAPLFTGYLIDRTGGYAWAFGAAAASALLAMAAWGLIVRRIAPVDWQDELSPHAATAIPVTEAV